MKADHLWAEEALALALQRLPEGSTVLDIGAGPGLHSAAFLRAGHSVTGVDIRPAQVSPGVVGLRWLQEDWTQGVFPSAKRSTRATGRADGYDLVWSSHFLEHAPDVGACLAKMRSAVAPGGLLAVTVPPLKHGVVGGHLSLWNLGLLAYRLVLAGFDCSGGSFRQYGYNLSAIVRREPAVPSEVLSGLAHDAGDIEALAPYFPPEWKAKEGFDGHLVQTVNWK
jgi:SAM-dependent methyltransferase